MIILIDKIIELSLYLMKKLIEQIVFNTIFRNLEYV